MAHANWMTLGLSPIPRPENGIDEVQGQIVTGAQDVFWAYCVTQPRTITALGVNVIDPLSTPTKSYRLSLWSLYDGSNGGNPAPIPMAQLTVGGNPVQTASFAPTQTGFQWYPLNSVAYTPARGEFLGVRLQLVGGTGSDATFAYSFRDFAKSTFPVANASLSTVDRYPIVGLKFADSTQPTAMANPVATIGEGSTRMLTDAAGQRLAMRFKFTYAGRGGSFKIAGLRVQASACLKDAEQGKFRIGLWHGVTNTLVQYKEIGAGQTGPAPAEWGYRDLFFSNTSGVSSSSSSSGSVIGPVSLAFDTPYYIGYERLVGEQYPDLAMNFIAVNSDADMGAYPCGTECYAAHWTQAGGTWHWEEYKYRRPLFDVILADLTQF